MAHKRTGLGRGIGALIPTSDPTTRPVDVFFPTSRRDGTAVAEDGGADSAASVASGASPETATDASDGLVPVPGARLVNLSPAAIIPNARQPRTEFDQEALEELVASIREVGVLEPVVVRPVEGDPGRYELIMGERRLRASKEAGLESIPAVVKDTADENMLRDALLENLHRSNLNPLEEASAYQQLLSDFGITQDELAGRIGRSRPQISNTLRLLRLPDAVQTRVASGVLSAGHARAILSVGEDEAMVRLADKIVNEDLSVRAAERAAATLAGESKPKKRPTAGRRQAYLDGIAERLGDRLNTRVRVSLGARRGQVTIDFATIQDLNRILSELGEDEGYRP